MSHALNHPARRLFPFFDPAKPARPAAHTLAPRAITDMMPPRQQAPAAGIGAWPGRISRQPDGGRDDFSAPPPATAMPHVSVIIPAHDRAAELPQTLASVAAQSFADWDVLVVDDHSAEDVAAVVAAADDPRIRYARLPDGRSGAPAARNFGAAATAGDYVIFLDSDDLLAPDALRRRVELLESRPDLEAAVWACQMFRDAAGDVPLLWNVLDKPGDDDLDRFLRGDIIWQTTSPAWRRSALAKVGPWDEASLSGQDWEFHLRALLAGLRYEKIDEVDHYWRIAGDARPSIGRSAALNERHALSWAATLGRLHDAFRAANRLDRRARLRFAALFFDAARRVGSFVSRRQSRRVWADARHRGLVGPRRYAEGWLLLVANRWPVWRGRIEARLARRWPDAFFAPDRATFNRARVPGGPPPRVSVVLPVHDAAPFVREAVCSILHQTLRDFELIVVDDGSTDGTPAILRRLERVDARLRVVTGPRRGLVAALNAGFALARGEFVARMDADDVAMPDRLAKQLAFLEQNPDVVLLGTQVRFLDPYKTPIGDSALPTDHAGIDALLLGGNGQAVVHPAAMLRRTAYDRVGGYRAEIARAADGSDVCEDLDLYLRLAEIGRVANLPQVLLGYRQHYASITRTKMAEQAQALPRIVGEAYARRGATLPADGSVERLARDYWTPMPRREQFREWGWMAVKRGRFDAALLHALSLLRRAPLDGGAWRLAYCAVRGLR